MRAARTDASPRVRAMMRAVAISAWPSGVKIIGRGGSPSERTFVAFVMPMMRMSVVSILNVLPIALPLGQNVAAIVSLTIATRGDAMSFADEKFWPAMSRMPTASKKPESAAV